MNVTLARQVGDFTKYVLDRLLRGVFHVGTTDMVDYFTFEKLVCKALGIREPAFEIAESGMETYQAALPARSEIPEALRPTVAEVLERLG